MPVLGSLLAPALSSLGNQLGLITGLASSERELIQAQTRESLLGVLHAKLARLLLLELNVARVAGRLRAADGKQRWHEFISLASLPSFWKQLTEHYPTLLPRLQRITRQRCHASLTFARRWSADRQQLASLCGQRVGSLQTLSFGAGDSHLGGFTVALVGFEGGRAVYKPRCMRVDAALRQFIAELERVHGRLNVRVPRVLTCADYGWGQFIEHRYAQDEGELTRFYRGIGQWLAILHLLRGCDMHSENLIAHGDTPVVIDCETLFAPLRVVPSSGLGHAHDEAVKLLSGTVLHTGLLPGRTKALGWRGADISGAGALPGQQPMMRQPVILLAETDQAHLGVTLAPASVAQNHPSPKPALGTYWPAALAAFEQLTETLRSLDQAGKLASCLQSFTDCRVRVVPRPTETYAEIARMLWHPVSLHDEAKARQRARDLLAKMAGQATLAPTDPAIIESEIEELLIGDIPYFSAVAGIGRLVGSRGDLWLSAGNLVAATLHHWRQSDVALNRNVIRASMVSAYLNDGWQRVGGLRPNVVRHADLEVRRRAQAAQLMRELLRHAIRADDGSVSWITPTLAPTGWSVQPMAMDLYSGLSGVALFTAAYVREMHAGRADTVEGVEQLAQAVQHAMYLAEARSVDASHAGIKTRPPAPGAYVGLGGRIWTLLALARWNSGRGDELQRAATLAEGLLEAAANDEVCDILAGRAGAIPLLLALAAQTGDARYRALALQLGEQLHELAQQEDGKAYWPHAQGWPRGLGGFSHGVTGIGWALAKLARATGEARMETLAQAAFRFEDDTYDEKARNWRDLRDPKGVRSAAWWCHGAVGIGLAHLDLDPQAEHPRTRSLLQRAVAATARWGLGSDHCLCHGDLGAWELLDEAIARGAGPDALTREGLQAYVLTSLEAYGPTCGLTRDLFVPGLLVGVSGVAYQLLRMHPDSGLPSVLLPGIGL